MNDSIKLDSATHAMARSFFEDYRIRSIGICCGADIRDDEISQVEINFFKDAHSDTGAYIVSFKLLDQAIDFHRYVHVISGRAEDFRVQPTAEFHSRGSDAVSGMVRDFIATIRERVGKIHKEQSILDTQPLGKIFVLNNKSRFKVVADDGEGQLSIEIQDKRGGREARLGMNDLLDGLYVGLITRE